LPDGRLVAVIEQRRRDRYLTALVNARLAVETLSQHYEQYRAFHWCDTLINARNHDDLALIHMAVARYVDAERWGSALTQK
jgi:hypothetical protein